MEYDSRRWKGEEGLAGGEPKENYENYPPLSEDDLITICNTLEANGKEAESEIVQRFWNDAKIARDLAIRNFIDSLWN